MLKVWRGPRTLFAECTDCGSYGSAPHLKTKTKLTPEIAEAVERHAATMAALRANFEGAARKIAQEVEAGTKSRDDGTKRVRELWTNHVAQVQLRSANLPSPDGQVVEVVVSCPWCGQGEEVEVEALPLGQDAPSFSLFVPAVPTEG